MKKAEVFPVAEASEQALDRRRFLYAAGAAAVLAIAGEWGAKGIEGARSAEPAALQFEPSLLQVGESRAVAGRNGGEALVVRVDAATVVGFDRRCPHLGCPVLWSAERGRFECPCHHAAFDARTGEVLFGPPRHGLKPVTIESEERQA